MSRRPSWILWTYRMALRALWPPGVVRAHADDAVATARALAEDAARGGRRAIVTYWRTEFVSLFHAARALRDSAIDLPDDGLSPKGSGAMFSAFLQDVRYAVRLLRRTPALTIVAVLTLALGIGANTAIFSLLYGVLIRPLPYPGADRLYMMMHAQIDRPDALGTMTPGNFYDLKRGATLMEPMAAMWRVGRTLTGRGEPERIATLASAGSVLEVLGVQPMLGRVFTEQDDRAGIEPVVVLSHSTWRRLFAENPAAIGQILLLNGTPTTVIGVMPPGFRFPDESVEMWSPGQMDAEDRASRTEYFLFGLARVRPGADAPAAESELAAIMEQLRREHPQANSNLSLSVRPLHETLVGSVRLHLWLLMASVACVLVIACANLANLLLAHAAVRRRELSIRQAIGAARFRLVRQLLTESLVLAVLGGAAGLLTGYLFLKGLIAWLPEGTPRLADVTIDGAVLLVTLGITITAGLAFGLAPAVQSSGENPAAALRDGGRGASGRSALRTGLVVAEMAIAVMLLAGAGLLLRSFFMLQQVDPGFSGRRLLTFNVSLLGPVYAEGSRRVEFVERAVERLRGLPGVEAAAAGSGVPVAGRGTGAWFNLIDRPLPSGETPPAFPYRVITTDYFRTVGIPLVRGRLLSHRDGLDGTPSVVISESIAKRFWSDPSAGDPIGAEIYLGAPDNRLFPRASIVGIVKDVKLAGLDSGITEAVYFLHALMPSWRAFTFAMRTTGEPASVAAAARHEIRQLDGGLPITSLRTMTEIVEASVAPTRASMLLLSLFAAVALAMAAIGVFGVLSYSVSQRSHELGIRLALGAEPQAVRRLVLREGMLQAAAGIAAGLLGAFWLTGYMSALLFEVPPRDPITFAGVALLLGAVAALACYLPARRATRIDPLVALQAE